jgi:sec-independent protein translocase protein TatA
MFAHPWQIIVVLIIAVLLFGGRGRISAIMGDVAKGIKSFRKGLTEEEAALEEEKKKAEEAEAAATTLKTEDPDKPASSDKQTS